jgi:hypothetical protein
VRTLSPPNPGISTAIPKDQEVWFNVKRNYYGVEKSGWCDILLLVLAAGGEPHWREIQSLTHGGFNAERGLSGN